MSSLNNLPSKIASLLAEVRPEYDFKSSNDFVVDGLIDSFDLIELILELEKAFNFKVPGSEVHSDNFRSNSSIADLVSRYIK